MAFGYVRRYSESASLRLKVKPLADIRCIRRLEQAVKQDPDVIGEKDATQLLLHAKYALSRGLLKRVLLKSSHHPLHAAARASHYLPEPDFVAIVNKELRASQKSEFDNVPKGVLQEMYSLSTLDLRGV